MSIYLLINFLKYGIGIVTVGTIVPSADLLTDHVSRPKNGCLLPCRYKYCSNSKEGPWVKTGPLSPSPTCPVSNKLILTYCNLVHNKVPQYTVIL